MMQGIKDRAEGRFDPPAIEAVEIGLWMVGLAEAVDSVDHDLRLKADHSPRLGHWTVVQREQFVIY
jgi:hypothetical protein